MLQKEEYRQTFGFMTQVARRMFSPVEDNMFHDLSYPASAAGLLL
jgi:hypothetical protein